MSHYRGNHLEDDFALPERHCIDTFALPPSPPRVARRKNLRSCRLRKWVLAKGIGLDICYPCSYTPSVIRSFRHKGLEEFFRTGSKKGIKPEQAARLKDILFRLQFAQKLSDLDFPGANLHPLKGELAGFHAVNVSGNWRLVFRFQDGDALEVNYLDYH